MAKKINSGILAIMALLVVSGCATGRNYQTDLDALNAKISALQGEISSRDQELAHLRSQVSQSEDAQREALARAESENRSLNEKLNNALDKLEAAKAAKVVKAVKKVEKKQEESDLK